jgi:K+/H+ antiporter YhaU regulatory subunit KhtT
MAIKFTFKHRFQYWFDNLMSSGAPAIISVLALISLFIIFVAGLLISLGGDRLAPEGAGPVSLFEAMWLSLVRTLDAGTMGQDAGWGFRTVMLLLPTLGGIFIISALIGVISNAVDEKINELQQGRSIVLEHGHTIIIGWTQSVFSIISEIDTAHLNQDKCVITILADREKVEMEEAIRQNLHLQKHTRVICRSGSPTEPAFLNMVSPNTARSIIILPPESENPDVEVIKILLSMAQNHAQYKNKLNIVTDMSEASNIAVAHEVCDSDNLCIIKVDEITSRVIAQTSRQSGLSVIYTDLLNFAGDEIYFKEVPPLVGKSYSEALFFFDDASVIGLIKAAGNSSLNPPVDTIIEQGDKLVVIAKDDSLYHVHKVGQIELMEGAIHGVVEKGFTHPEKILFIGWNRSAQNIIKQMDHYVKVGSQAMVVAKQEILDSLGSNAGLENIQILSQLGEPTDRAVLDALHVENYHHVIVLPPDMANIQMADASVILILLHLRAIQKKANANFNIVAEMNDIRNRDLATVTKIDDFIVSNHFISILMAQLSENPDLMPVFNNLFDADGSEIYLKPAKNYVQLGQPVNYATVVESARRLGESAIGYKIRAEKEDAENTFGIYTNPLKSKVITFAEKDMVIVLAKE